MSRFVEKIKIFFQSNNRKKIFRICVPALILVAVFALASFFAMYANVKNSYQHSNKLIIGTASKTLNDIFKDIDNVYKTIENNVNVKNVFNPDNELYSDDENIINAVNTMNSALITKAYMEEILILKRDIDVVITSKGIMTKRDFFEKNYVNKDYGASFFDNLDTDYQNVKIISFASYKNMEKYPAEDPKSLLTCVKRNIEQGITILIFISRDEFVKEANLNLLGGEINFKIYDNNDSVIFSNSDSEYMINTTGLSDDFSEEIINYGFKKYYIYKSDYNYFYYVAEVKDILTLVLVIAILLILSGFALSFFYLMQCINRLDNGLAPAFEELEMEKDEGDYEILKDKISEYKSKIENTVHTMDTMSDEIKSSIFLKIISSSSFYGRFRETADGIFSDVLGSESFFILSVETIRENIKMPKYEVNKIKELLSLNMIDFVYIEEKTRKNIFVIGCKNSESLKIIASLNDTFKDIRNNGIEILLSYSNEFSNLSNLYEAFHDIIIIRNYRGINDKISLLGINDISYKNNLYLPPNFKEELTSKIIAREEGAVKKYIKDIFDENINNNIPLSKFEFMLRQMLNALIDALSMNKKNSSDIYQLEQVFFDGIEQLKENYDMYGIMNNFINLVHLSSNAYNIKKNALNRADVIKYINSNYKNDLYLENVAEEFNTTYKYFSNYFKKEFTVGFNEYLTSLRISQAKKLLLETDKPLNVISEEVGYLNQATFAAAFKKITGLPPGKYREINKL